jgi:serine/threonine-protein kinase HipA
VIALAYWALGAGNNDDHARNHAAFWDGDRELLTLTPAYDITPQPRAGGETRQLMAIGEDGWRMADEPAGRMR